MEDACLLLRAVAWPAVTGISAAAVIVGAGGVVWPAAAPSLLAISFALLAGAAAFVLDEPASTVVDVSPTGWGARTAVRALALLVPLGAGGGLVLAGVLRAVELPWPAVALALAGNVLLGFAVACAARRYAGEPGAQAASAAAFVLISAGIIPAVARRVHTFPVTDPDSPGLSSTTSWWIIGGACLAAIAVSRPGARPRRS